jgi:cell division protein FtsB
MARLPDRGRPSGLRHLRLAILFLMHRERAAVEREIDQLTAANAALAEEVRNLRTDPARAEAIAREELGLVKPGDLVYEFRPAAPPQAKTEASR